MEDSNVKNSSIIIDFFTVWFYIPLYALRGIKYVFFDMWKNIITKINDVKHGAKLTSVQEKAIAIRLYEKTKSKAKKEKQYKYSAKQMTKYEKMKAELNEVLKGVGSVRSKTQNVYEYTARKINGNGKIIHDHMSGLSVLDIYTFLVNDGYEVFDIKTSDMINFFHSDTGFFAGKIKTKDLVFILTQLATYIKAGITVNESIKLLILQMKSKPKQQKIFKSVAYELTVGNSLSVALSKQGNYFPPLLVNMMKAAEAAGNLQETLTDMASYYTEVDETNREMKSALTYPAIICVFSIGVVVFIIMYVVPNFTKVYGEAGVEISGLTAIIVAISNFLINYYWVVLLVLVGTIVTLWAFYRFSKSFRVNSQVFFMHVPVFSKVIKYKEINIFAKTFSSLLKNNVYITDSMDILGKITSNEVYKTIIYKTIDNIIKGDKISEAFKNHWAVPDIAYFMIVTGESTGQLADMLQKTSDYFQSEHKAMVNSLKTLIEPVMIIFLAAIVAMVIIAVIVPMFSLYNNVM